MLQSLLPRFRSTRLQRESRRRSFSPRSSRVLIAVGLIAVAAAAGADERPDRQTLPTLDEMELPSAETLMTADAFDWVVLKDGNQVVVVEPLYPRPDTLQKRDEERRRLQSLNRRTEEERERLAELSNLTLNLAGDVLTEYELPITSVERIILHEELMLQRVDRLLDEGRIRTAYDLLLTVDRSLPDWKPAVPRFERLLLTEAELRAGEGDVYAALALLDELATRNLENPELFEQYGALTRPMIDEAVAAADYARARYLIGRLTTHFPQHPVAEASRNQLQALAQEKLSEAVRLEEAGQLREAAELARESSDVWPPTGNDRSQYSRVLSRHQVLRVGVESFHEQPAVYPLPLPGNQRMRELTQVPLFEPASADELTYFRSSFFEKWDPSDLGREVVFTLRETRPYWQTQPVLTANTIADAIARRLDDRDPLFDSRLASFVSEFSVRSPTELKLRFSRVPLSIEALLRFPVVVRETGADDSDSGASVDEGRLLSTRFRPERSDETSRTFARTVPEPEGLETVQYHVAEVVEQSFDSRHEMLQSMIRGDLEYIPELRPWEIDAFRSASGFQTVPHAIPRTHVIVFNPASEGNTSAQLRRCMSLAIDRAGILANVVLRDSEMRYGCVTSAAWHQSSYATNRVVEAPEYDIRRAYALRFAAERQLQLRELKRLEEETRAELKATYRTEIEAWRQAAAEAEARGDDPPPRPSRQELDGEQFRAETDVSHIRLPPLRMVVEPDEVSLAAAEKIQSYWEKINLDVELIPGDRNGEPLGEQDWDLMYRRVRMYEPLLEAWPVLTSDPNVDIDRLNYYPDWMRQEVIGLDYSGSFLEAQDRLFTLHRHLAAQAFVIPLWEVDQYAVFQSTVGGFPEELLSAYQNVERWTIRP